MVNTQGRETDTRTIDGALFADMVRAGAANLRANAAEVNELNVFPVPDGDTGDNMSMTAEGGAAALAESGSMTLGETAAVASRGMLLGARGNSGVILSQFFAGIAKALDGHDTADVNLFADALRAGVKQAYDAVMSPAEGTILTVAREGVAAACDAITDADTVYSLISRLVDEMRASLARTPELLPVLREAGVVDSGGAGLVYVVDGFRRALAGEKIETVGTVSSAVSPSVSAGLSSFGPDSEMTYGYCTELLLQLQNSKTDPESFDPAVITEFLGTVGNSVVSFKTGTVVKLHVHTMEPERVLGFCRQFGEFLTVKIENMSVQHSGIESDGDDSPTPETDAPAERYGFVAVASGDGMKKLFRELGAEVIDGGQTNNPSTADFVAAFERMNAEHIYVFPNNKNIILAANQASEMYTKATVHVIPSADIGAGYVALSSADRTCDDPDSLAKSVTEAMANVTTGMISTSIRDTVLGGIEIHRGDYIGFIGKEMVVSDPSKENAATALLDRMLNGADAYMLTVFRGAGADVSECAAVEHYAAEHYPDVEIYMADGGQDVYPFIFVAEE